MTIKKCGGLGVGYREMCPAHTVCRRFTTERPDASWLTPAWDEEKEECPNFLRA